jgi:hypothetical protein
MRPRALLMLLARSVPGHARWLVHIQGLDHEQHHKADPGMEEVALQALRDGHLLLYCATSAMEPTVGMCKAKTAVEKIVADFLPKHIQPRYLSIFTSRWSGKGRSTPSTDAAR